MVRGHDSEWPRAEAASDSNDVVDGGAAKCWPSCHRALVVGIRLTVVLDADKRSSMGVRERCCVLVVVVSACWLVSCGGNDRTADTGAAGDRAVDAGGADNTGGGGSPPATGGARGADDASHPSTGGADAGRMDSSTGGSAPGPTSDAGGPQVARDAEVEDSPCNPADRVTLNDDELIAAANAQAEGGCDPELSAVFDPDLLATVRGYRLRVDYAWDEPARDFDYALIIDIYGDEVGEHAIGNGIGDAKVTWKRPSETCYASGGSVTLSNQPDIGQQLNGSFAVTSSSAGCPAAMTGTFAMIVETVARP